MFLLYDVDNDGVLNTDELNAFAMYVQPLFVLLPCCSFRFADFFLWSAFCLCDVFRGVLTSGIC
jgi:hypothetical protein